MRNLIMRNMGGILVDVVVALLILMISGAIFNQIAGVEEGETAPAWVGILPLVLAMIWLLWRTSQRRRARRARVGRRTDPARGAPRSARP